MALNRLVEGMPITFSTAPPDCDSCILGKQTKNPVPKKHEEGPGHRATQKPEKVWVDLIGPISVSASGNQYVMDLLDDSQAKHSQFFSKVRTEPSLNSKLGNSLRRERLDSQ